MQEPEIKKLLENVERGKTGVAEAMKKLKNLPFEDIGFAKIDHHRSLRKGFPEVIFCQNKSVQQVEKIVGRMLENGSDVIATRASEEMFTAVKKIAKNAEYNKYSKTIVVLKSKKAKKGKIAVLCAGTSDIPVAEEAAVVADAMGNKVEKIYDVGVAGLHRLLANMEKLSDANVIVIVAGMDGALPSVVSGITDKPIVAVPTSVGYGASFRGIAPLLTMLNACSPGVVVVNIDNGFGAGYFASMINKNFENKK